MSDSIEKQREQWHNAVEHYEYRSKKDDSYQPMLDLVRWLSGSPYSSRISVSISHDILDLSAQETSRRGQWQMLLISCWRDEPQVEFYRYELDGGYTKWPRDYAADELRAAIEAWLWRLEMDNAWEFK